MPDCCVTVSLVLRDVLRGHPIAPVRLCEGETRMSSPKDDRKIQTVSGRRFQFRSGEGRGGSSRFADAIAAALPSSTGRSSDWPVPTSVP